MYSVRMPVYVYEPDNFGCDGLHFKLPCKVFQCLCERHSKVLTDLEELDKLETHACEVER